MTTTGYWSMSDADSWSGDTANTRVIPYVPVGPTWYPTSDPVGDSLREYDTNNRMPWPDAPCLFAWHWRGSGFLWCHARLDGPRPHIATNHRNRITNRTNRTAHGRYNPRPREMSPVENPEGTKS